MAMSMQELFYGECEPVHFVHYGRHHSYAVVPELSTFDLMVPMCCARCEDQVRDALFALRTVGNVDCDAPNQRVTVTGCLEPAHALKQVRRVKNGATLWSSSYSAQRYMQQGNRDRSRSSYVQLEQRSSRRGQFYNRSSSDAYTRSLCPAYRDSTETHYVSVNPRIATRVEMEC
jgi:hypothetical protein